MDQVENSEEHRLLQGLRQCHLSDAGLRQAFYQRVIESLDMGESSYVILLAADAYDIPYKGSDGDIFSDGSAEVFDYFLCCICPVKDAKAELTYKASEQSFRETSTGRILTAPELGFMFPCFDDRSTNIYNALYYSRNVNDIHDDFIQGMFGAEQAPMSAGEQQANFCGALTDSLGEDCSLDVVISLHEQIRDRLEQHKESKEADPPEIYIEDMDEILTESGVSSEKIETFNDSITEAFGDRPSMNPNNLLETKKFQLATTGVRIHIDPEYVYSIRTQVIDGQRYILVPAPDTVELNGIEVSVDNID